MVSSCSDAVKYLQRKLSSTHSCEYDSDVLYDEYSVNHIEVRRQFVFEDALKEARKQKFSPEKCFKVIELC